MDVFFRASTYGFKIIRWAKNQLVHHGAEGLLYGFIFDVEHRTFLLIQNVSVAAPCCIFVSGAGMNPALEGITAFSADDPAGKSIAFLILFASFDDAFLS